MTGPEGGCCLRDLQACAVTRPAASAAPTQKMALPALTAMAAGLMIGSGIFMLPRRFGDATGVFGADRLGGRRRRHVHAGAGVPVARPAKAPPRRRRLRARCGLDFDLNPIILEAVKDRRHEPAERIVKDRFAQCRILRRVIIIKMLLLATGATYGFEARKRPTEGIPWTPLSS